jgi:hypothetical protein
MTAVPAKPGQISNDSFPGLTKDNIITTISEYCGY